MRTKLEKRLEKLIEYQFSKLGDCIVVEDDKILYCYNYVYKFKNGDRFKGKYFVNIKTNLNRCNISDRIRALKDLFESYKVL